MKYLCSFVVAALLSSVALWRGDFSLDVISAPLTGKSGNEPSHEIAQVLRQPYHFLGKGRQAFVFVSEDGKTVLKFFNQRYIQTPWYSFLLWDQEKELRKREQRKSFYLHSYCLAEKFLQKETALLYTHFKETSRLPSVVIKDQTSRSFSIDLNLFPFVLQRKGDPFYATLQHIQKEKGDEAFISSLDNFLQIIADRISKGIADGDHDVEHNFGFLDGKPFHLDPGRLHRSDFSTKDILSHEWWAATHSLRKWLQNQYPQIVPVFDSQLEEMMHSPVYMGYG